ncbi:hypothetical protein GGI23_002688, partial [Coemansia sp. RSA 2559]
MDRLIEARSGLPDIFEPDLHSCRLNQMVSINMVLAGSSSGGGMDELLNSDSPAGRYARRRMANYSSNASSESDSEEIQFPIIPDAMYSPSEEKYPFLQNEIGLK